MGIDILIPVLNRPESVPLLVDSIRAATRSEHTIYFICSRGDRPEIEAVEAAGLEPLVFHSAPGPGDFAKKINWAFEQTDAEWVFQGADDIRFSDRWDIYALAVAKKSRASVIGTNDLHNPSVKRGEHSTHTLIRRSYIERYGGTFDNSGRVFHEGYDHQYVDNEFIVTATQRGEFAFSPKSVVEHFHPHWGNARMDSTYTKAMRKGMRDRRLYRDRLRMITGEGYRRPRRYSSPR